MKFSAAAATSLLVLSGSASANYDNENKPNNGLRGLEGFGRIVETSMSMDQTIELVSCPLKLISLASPIIQFLPMTSYVLQHTKQKSAVRRMNTLLKSLKLLPPTNWMHPKNQRRLVR
jgi:hypothetical protein